MIRRTILPKFLHGNNTRQNAVTVIKLHGDISLWHFYNQARSELSTGRMDLRVGSGRSTILPDFGGAGRVSTSDILVFLLIISWYLNR